jgi:hypothetical protein
MIPCLFIHDFFGDGRSDATSEVRILRDLGQWTEEKRASWIKEAHACCERLKYTHPSLPQARAYYAGRLAALKSRQTADVLPKENTPAYAPGTFVYRPLPPNEHHFCGLFDCGSDAVWGVSYFGFAQILLTLCDPCRQEWVRMKTVYTEADGWDWDGDEDNFGIA